jgi:hypothetical protein
MLGFVDKRDSQINWCLIQPRSTSPSSNPVEIATMTSPCVYRKPYPY